MRRFLEAAVALVFALCASIPLQATCVPRNIGGSALKQRLAALSSAKPTFQESIQIGGIVRMNSSVELTAQGNGTIRIANLLFRAYSDNDAAIRYKDDVLDVLLVPAVHGAYCDILVSGVIKQMDEQKDEVLDTRPAVALYGYDPAKRLFVRRYIGQDRDFDLTRGER